MFFFLGEGKEMQYLEKEQLFFWGGEEKRRRKRRKIFGEGKSERSLPDGSDEYTFTT